jgi:hypothetical protein
LQQEEIDRLSLRTNDKAIGDLKAELRKSYDVMIHLKKKLNDGGESTQYNAIMCEVMSYLNIPQPEKPQVEKRASVIKSDHTANSAQPSQKFKPIKSSQPSFTDLPANPVWATVLQFLTIPDLFKF